MVHRDIIVMGGSTGGLEALRRVLRDLPGDLDAAVFVVLHTSPDSPGVVDRILARVTSLSVKYAENGEPIRSGHVYIAPADRHLLVKRDRVCVTRGPRENRFRPAVDPLFRTAAVAYD